MDGQFEREGTGMSHIQVGGVDLCDNLSNPQALAAQTRNLNETNTLTHTQSLSPAQSEDGGGHGLIEEASLSGRGREGCTGRAREEDEEEDLDEVMKEEEEEEESEGSSCPIRCQSPGTPMTDSSYSETGSLLETPYPFSPGTSPEPTSPTIPAVSPETSYPIRPAEMGQIEVKLDCRDTSAESAASGSGSVTLAPVVTTGPIDPPTQTKTSDTHPDSPPGSTSISAKTTHTTAEHLTSSTEPLSDQGSTVSTTKNPISAAATALLTPNLTTLSATTGTKSTSIEGPLTFNWEHIITSTPVPTCFSVPTCATGPISSPALLESLEHLAKRGDEPNLPQYLHQIAEAFVLQEDYQRALWCIQLERLYHQRVLDNLNALKEQWESQCGGTSSNLATQHLDTLKHICQTHSRSVCMRCSSQNLLKPTTAESVALLPCSSVHQSEDSSHPQASRPVRPSINSADGHNSLEMSDKDRGDPDRLLQGRASSDRDGGEPEEGIGCTIPVLGNDLHPSLTGEMDQSKPAEQQGGDLGLAQEKEAKREEEESEVEEAAEALEMEEEGEEEEEEKQGERDSTFHQGALPVETLISGAAVELQHLHQEAVAEEKLHEETQDGIHLDRKTHLPHETYMKQQEEAEGAMEEEEEEEDYELEQADLIREAAVLDDMAKLITVEEISPASGLVSILKKRKVCVDNVSVSATSESRPGKPPAKRRVHFKVPDDGYEHDVGGGDSCLLLFLLCMVTVVISVGGTALYCALGDAHSSVCQDFSRNADFYMGQLQRGIAQIQHWFAPGS
ncbi:consortin [Xyrichtys novacula]|uniref:Consortin n=1 Tax=Xyrichtys novacula TaxID=13765 RepID=A0AAV1EJN5_XYRNO|nr:consortin [Xyrichtys novacula]